MKNLFLMGTFALASVANSQALFSCHGKMENDQYSVSVLKDRANTFQVFIEHSHNEEFLELISYFAKKESYTLSTRLGEKTITKFVSASSKIAFEVESKFFQLEQETINTGLLDLQDRASRHIQRVYLTCEATPFENTQGASCKVSPASDFSLSPKKICCDCDTGVLSCY